MKYAQLVKAIDAASHQLLGRAAAAVNQALVMRNWFIGARIVQFQQQGQDRANYGERLLERLAADLARRGLRGLDERTLRDCRLVFQVYPQIRGTLSPEFGCPPAAAALTSIGSSPVSVNRLAGLPLKIRGTVSPEFPTPLSSNLVARFSWSKLQEFIRIDDPLKRAFYENECLKGNWSVRPFRHGDAGQMNFYLNWWKNNALEPGDNPPVGIILCSGRDKTKVEFATDGMDNKLFVSRYLVNLPSAEQLSRFVETGRARIEAALPHDPAPRKTRRATRSRPRGGILSPGNRRHEEQEARNPMWRARDRASGI
jgi:hypothetical protein